MRTSTCIETILDTFRTLEGSLHCLLISVVDDGSGFLSSLYLEVKVLLKHSSKAVSLQKSYFCGPLLCKCGERVGEREREREREKEREKRESER